MTLRTRRLAATVAAALMLLTPVACGSDDDDATDTPITTEAPTPGTDDGGDDPDSTPGDDTESDPDGDNGNDGPATTAGSDGGDQGQSPQPGTVEAFCTTIQETDASEVNTPEGLAAVLRDIHEVAPPEVADTLGELIEIVESAESVDDLDGDARGIELNETMSDYTNTHCD